RAAHPPPRPPKHRHPRRPVHPAADSSHPPPQPVHRNRSASPTPTNASCHHRESPRPRQREPRGTSPMHHPFFDVAAFPWERRDARDLHEVLYDAISDHADIKRLYRSSAAGLPGLANGTPKAMWTQALDDLTRAGALKTFCEHLLDKNEYRALHPTL